jgi:GNAT superfamily N-acetyltransferase
MKFEPVDLLTNLELCINFRRDAHILSYDSSTDFNSEECTAWFHSLKANNPTGFEHVILNNEIIGQLEFKSGVKAADGSLSGYINLLYLLPEYRRKGYGLKLQEYVHAKFIADNCSVAYLRYLPRNQAAGSFYIKHGWNPEGASNERGQLMVKSLLK